MTVNTRRKHQAGRHLAVAEALLRGYPARLQGDVTFIEVNERVAVVRATSEDGWVIDPIERIIDATSEGYVLVDLTEDKYDFYVVPGDEMRRAVTEEYPEVAERAGGNPDSRLFTIKQSRVQSWLNGWSLFDR